MSSSVSYLWPMAVRASHEVLFSRMTGAWDYITSNMHACMQAKPKIVWSWERLAQTSPLALSCPVYFTRMYPSSKNGTIQQYFPLPLQKPVGLPHTLR